MPRPRVGDELELQIDDVAFGGAGVGRDDGFVVFVADAAPGERVRAWVRKSRRRHAEAELLEVVGEPAPARREAPCPFVPRCGGCRLQHLDYEATLDAKRRQIVEHLARIGGLSDIDVRPVDGAEPQLGYRNKMEYSFGRALDGGLALGLHARGRWDEILDLSACLIASPRLDEIRATVREWAASSGLAPYDQREQVGDLRHLVLREGTATGQALATLVTSEGERIARAADELATQLVERHPDLVGVLHAVNAGVAESTQGLPSRVVWGRDHFAERVRGVELRLSATAFFQTNTHMTETLYGRVAEAAGLDGGQVLYDLFAGAGAIGIALGREAREVVAVEIQPEAVEDARRNAGANGLTAHRALCGDVGKVLRENREELPDPDVAIVDPPRAGLNGKAVKRILEFAPPALVYVSCQPATFAENAAKFVAGGYALEYVQPVDMFPQTPHIEAVARFTRVGAPSVD
ncbi:MAG: 23S rRNA (uracil(1939)-C(5))-methyltransferase RlmD [Miltoncostaeaceae bacterium]